MAASQSGYPMLTDYGDPALTSNPTVPGTDVEVLGGLRSGAPMTILLDVAQRFNATVEPLVQSDGIWGFDPQHNTYTSTSNHKSGTAVDLNADKHPIGTAPSASFTAAQIATIHAIVARYGGVVRWGGDYTGRQDPMHFEINDDLYGTGRVEAAAAALNSVPRNPVPPLEDDMPLSDDDVAKVAAAAAEAVLDTVITVRNATKDQPTQQRKVRDILADVENYSSRAARDTADLKAQS